MFSWMYSEARPNLLTELTGRVGGTDYAMEQEMEIEALEAILMDEFKEVDGQGSDGLDVDTRCFMITIAPKDADEEEPTEIPGRQ
eukprot:5785175-Pyramimonas_sp.AAC.2